MIASYMRSRMMQHGFLEGNYPMYAALFSVAPDDNGFNGVELLVGRVAVTAAMLEEYEPGKVRNLQAVAFAAVYGAPAIVAVGLFDAPTGGNLLAFTTCPAYTPVDGAEVEWPPATFIIRLD